MTAKKEKVISADTSSISVNKAEFADMAYQHLKFVKGGLSSTQIRSITDAKSVSYAEAVRSTDEAIAELREIATQLQPTGKTALDAVVTAVENFAMFNGEAALSGNSSWQHNNGEYGGEYGYSRD